MILQYSNNIYPVDLYVGTFEDIKRAEKIFYFYESVERLMESEPIEDAKIKVSSASGVTFLVSHKKDISKGILILLNLEILKEGNYQYILETVSHESSHAVDATYQLIHQESGTYDEGNEPHAYLTGWYAGCIGDYLMKQFKNNNGRKEV